MTDNFVGVILSALGALDPYRDRLRIETDDISTLLVGPPEVLFPAMRDVFVAAAQSGEHVTFSAAISRGCPGEPDEAICNTGALADPLDPLAARQAAAREAVAAAPPLGQAVAAQFSLHIMGTGQHMDEIYGCIDFLKASGVFDRSKHFCSVLRGDVGPVFATLAEAFCRFGPPEGHVTIDLTVAANSPTAR